MPATAYAAEGRVRDHKPLYPNTVGSRGVGAFSFVVGSLGDSDGSGGRCLQVLGSCLSIEAHRESPGMAGCSSLARTV